MALIVQCTGPIISQYAGPQCTFSDFIHLMNNVAGFIFQLSIGLVVLMIVWGAFMMMLSGGDPAKFKSGRMIITYAFIGLAVVLSSYIVVETVIKILAPG